MDKMLTASEVAALHSDPELGPVARIASKAGPESAAWHTVSLNYAARQAAERLALETGTCWTMSFSHWYNRAIESAHVSVEDTRAYALTLLYDHYDIGTQVREVVPLLVKTVRAGRVDASLKEARAAEKRLLRKACGLI